MVVVGVGEHHQVDHALPKWQRFPQLICGLFRAGPAINEDMLAGGGDDDDGMDTIDEKKSLLNYLCRND